MSLESSAGPSLDGTGASLYQRRDAYSRALRGDLTDVALLDDLQRAIVVHNQNLASGKSTDVRALHDHEIAEDSAISSATDGIVGETEHGRPFYWPPSETVGFAPDEPEPCENDRPGYVCHGCAMCAPEAAIPTVEELEQMWDGGDAPTVVAVPDLVEEGPAMNAEEAEESSAPEPPVRMSMLVPGTWHREHERPPTEYRVDGMSARGIITSWGGYPGAGKTPTLLMMIEAVTTGEPTFVGHKVFDVPDDYRVIYLTEESPQLFESKIEQAYMTDAALARMDIAYWDRNYTVRWDRMIAEQRDRLQGNGMLVVDTALAWAGRMDEGSENDSSVMTEMYRPLMLAVADGLDVHVLVHTTKAVPNLRRDVDFNLGHIRGSGAVVASSGLVWGIKIPAAVGRRSNQRYLAVLRDKLTGATESMYTRLGWSGNLEQLTYADLGDGSEDAETVDAAERVLEAIDLLVGAHEVATANAIRSTAGMGRDAVFGALAELEAAEIVTHVSKRDGYVRNDQSSDRPRP